VSLDRIVASNSAIFAQHGPLGPNLLHLKSHDSIGMTTHIKCQVWRGFLMEARVILYLVDLNGIFDACLPFREAG